jgi:hypothetical protein
MALTTVRPQGMGFNTGRRNLIINGAMQVAQRGTQSTGITTTGFRTVDRFRTSLSSLGTWTEDQATDAPDGFSNSFKLTCTTADASPAAGDVAYIRYMFEGNELQGLAYGASSAKALTLSFWVKSNKTGSASIQLLQNDNSSKNISPSYTISSANTWEYKTVSIPADTAGNIDNDNGPAVSLIWWLNSGSTYSSGSTQTSWATYSAADSNPANLGVGGATSDYFQITGVQLEVGTNASDFEHRSYGEELALCKRYYQRWDATALDATSNKPIGAGVWYTSTQILAMFNYDEMRASPTFTASSTGFVKAYGGGFAEARTGGNGIDGIGTKAARFNFTCGARTAGQGTMIQMNANGDYLELDAEL